MMIVLALASISFASAQKGTVLVAGNVGFSSQKINTSESEAKQNIFGISPKVGYQYNDNWTVGIQSSATFLNGESSSTNNGSSSADNLSNYYSVGPFVRYAKPLNDTFAVYADLVTSYNFGSTRYNSSISTSTVKSSGFGIGITPALQINIKKGFGLNFGFGGLGYNSNKTTAQNTSDNPQKTKIFEFNFGQSFNAGISKNF